MYLGFFRISPEGRCWKVRGIVLCHLYVATQIAPPRCCRVAILRGREAVRADRRLRTVRRETGKELRVRVPNDKGLASHIVPESCVRSGREAHREALTGVREGQPLSREIIEFRDADAFVLAEGNTDRRAIASDCPVLRGPRPWHARTLFAREPGDLRPGPDRGKRGPHREGEEP